MTLILSSHTFAIAYGGCAIAECIHLPQPDQRRSLKDIIMYYVKQVARPSAWVLP
ncbi:hypothetical protein [Nostoc sp.]|uniref:hypothetical protein n=1 Tax=Nostoc sp. TaxID=1180 RepID=UPI002FF8E839